jgi:hypothetical protein
LVSGGAANLATTFLSNPALDPLTQNYQTSAFWRYAFEQFGHPLGSDAHPTGTQSAFPRPDVDMDQEAAALLTRDSRQGLDLYGLYLDALRTLPPWTSTPGAIDAVSQQHIGRSLDALVRDFWTALYLKDYNETRSLGGVAQTRWRYEWTGDYQSATPIELSKPFDVPPNASTLDGLKRGFRYLDSPTLPLGGGIAGGPHALGPRSSAAYSIRPDTQSPPHTIRSSLPLR